MTEPNNENQLPTSHARLVDKLTQDLQPVKVACPMRSLVSWLLVATAIIMTIIFFIGKRYDLDQQLTNSGFLTTTLVLVLGVIVSAWLTLKYSIPGREPSPRASAAMITLPLLMCIFIFTHWAFGQTWQSFLVHFSHGSSCAISIVSLAILPLIFLTLISFKFAPLHSWGSAIMISSASLFLAALTAQIHCYMSDGCHLAIWHYLPIFLGTFILAFPLQYFISRRWKSKI